MLITIPARLLEITAQKPEFVESIVEKADSLPKVEKVQYSKDVVDSIARVASTTRILGLAIVGSHRHGYDNHPQYRSISVYSRRREINIMKYIGATDWYIRWPFLMEGALLGLFGAVISSGLVAAMYSLVEKRMGGSLIENNLLSLFQLLPLDKILYPITVLFLLVGGIIGMTASMLSMRKHLRV